MSPKKRRSGKSKPAPADKIVAAMRYVWPRSEIVEYDDPIGEVMETINLHLRALLAEGNDVLANSVILIGSPVGRKHDLVVETKCDRRLADHDATGETVVDVPLVAPGDDYTEAELEARVNHDARPVASDAADLRAIDADGQFTHRAAEADGI